MKYDLIIIGAGPAGLTAGIYAARYKLKTLIIGKLPGGLASEASNVCNFPSHEKITGPELMMKMIKHVKNMGVEIKHEEVADIEKGKVFKVFTDKKEYEGEKIILAVGGERRRLQLENEKKFLGKGISYCATCDAGFYKDKIAGVIGGGNAALSTALLLAEFARKVYLIYRKDKFLKAEPALREKVDRKKNIEKLFNSNVTNLIGKDRLEKIEINNSREISVDGIFVEIGSVQNIELADKLKIAKEEDYIKVDKKQKTNVRGVFAAGDITNNPLKQIVTACGEGAIAADTAYRELREE
jgi:thioredoxin reductase (NADPH)